MFDTGVIFADMNPTDFSLAPSAACGAAGHSRRTVLFGLGGALCALGMGARPALAANTSAPDASLTALLDGLAAALTADAGHAAQQQALRTAAAQLGGIRPEKLSSDGRVLLAAVRDGIETEAALLSGAGQAGSYALALRLNAGPGLSPHEAHQWGQARVRALQAEADRILRAQGLTSGTVAERLRAFMRDPRHLYPNTEVGRRRAVEAMNAQLAATRERLGQAFRNLSPANLSVSTLPPEQATKATIGKRIDPSADGTRPGGYVVDLREIERRPAWTLPSVVHHELAPGHLLQAPFGERAHAHPVQQRYAKGYSEGWAIYAEQLAAEQGWLGDDPLARLGYIHWMLFRTGRLVADTGIHALGWSAQQAIDAVREIQGEPVAFITIEEDVSRMVANPGAAAGQMLAAACLSRLRDDAQARLGARFTLAGFHEAVLRHGPLSNPGLEAAVKNWIETASA
ncbi:DUF885 domain-containing protein [Pedomonas mirosovicensis]|uniref:DUF885 domain-containing protein n=1 Tax=Pedomonas mirosovicensis TaxID=2908641 RepID=UPI00216879B5|nr:DUF885 family protein [Pedomonas mirosovicensis]MCH8686276.1 DUF885 family protein [Pedomonas mirosovicensis]